MLGKALLAAGTFALLACGTSAQAAPLHHKRAVGNATCQHALIAGFQAIEVTTTGVPLPPYTGTYAVNGKFAFTATADGQFYTPAVVDGLNVVTDSQNGVVVASCSITVSGLIYP